MTSLVGCSAIGLSVAGVFWKLPFGLMAGPMWLALIGTLVAAPMRRTMAALRAALSEVAAEVGLMPIEVGSWPLVTKSEPVTEVDHPL